MAIKRAEKDEEADNVTLSQHSFSGVHIAHFSCRRKGFSGSSSPIFYVLELNRGTCAVVCCGSLTIRPGWRIKMLVRPSAIL